MREASVVGSAKSVPYRAFQYSPYLAKVHLSRSVTLIKRRAFTQCYFRSIDIPESVTAVESWAFAYCYYLESITIPNSVRSIGTECFFHCYNLTSVKIPANVARLGYNPFVECLNLKSIDVDERNPKFQSIDGVLFSKDKTVLVAYPMKRSKEYAIPKGVISVGKSAFYKCRMESITLPNYLMRIEDYAFYYCCHVTELVLPFTVNFIGKCAFFGWNELRSVVASSSILGILANAFRVCFEDSDSPHDFGLNYSDVFKTIWDILD